MSLERGSVAGGAAGRPVEAGEAALVIVAAGVAILLWAGTAAATRVAVGTIDPLLLGALRTVGAALVAAPLLVVLRLTGPRTLTDWCLLLLSAAGSFVIFPVLFTLGAARTSASHASLIQAAMPIFTGLTAAAVERRRPPALWWVGACIAFAGETVLIGARDQTGTAATSGIGDLLVLAACLCSGMGYVAGARLAARLTPLGATLWVIVVASLGLVPLVAWRWSRVAWGAIGISGWALVVYLAIGSTLLAFIAWYWALAHGNIRRVAVLQFAQPVLSVALAVWLLGESLTLPLVFAGVAILAGIAVARRRP